MKKTIALILSVLMLVCILPVSVFADWAGGTPPTLSFSVPEKPDADGNIVVTVTVSASSSDFAGYTIGVEYDNKLVLADISKGRSGIEVDSKYLGIPTANEKKTIGTAGRSSMELAVMSTDPIVGTKDGFTLKYNFKINDTSEGTGAKGGAAIFNICSVGTQILDPGLQKAPNLDFTTTKTCNIPMASEWTTEPTVVTGLVYGDESDLVVAGVADGGEAQYAVDGGTFSANVPKNTDLTAGDHKVQYMIKGDEEHKDTEAAELTVTIAPAPIYPEDLADLAITPNEGLVYTGEEQDLLTITYKDKPVDANVYYKDLGYTIKVVNPKAKDAKEDGYSVTYSIEPDANHYYAVTDDTAAVSVAVELNKVTVKIARKGIDPKVDAMPTVTANNGVLAYSANPLVKVDNSKSVKGVAVEFSVDGGGRSAAVPTATGVAAGTHYVAYYYIAADTTNYYLIGQDTELTDTVEVTVAAGGGGLPTAPAAAAASSGGAAASQTQTVTDEEGNTITTEKKADGSQVITFNTKDGTTGKFEINASGVLTAGEVKISDKALEEALKSGEPMSMPEGVKVPAATSQQTAAPIVITLPKFESAGKPVTELPKFKVELTEVLESIVGFIKNEGESEATLIRESVMGSLTVPLEGSCTLYIVNNAKSFTDVSAGQWFAKNVSYVTAREIFNGVSDNMFAPDSNMSRAMFAQVLYNFARGAQAGDGTVFTDVKAEQWFSDVAGWAKANGVFNGKADGSFGPDEDISRQDLITTLYRFAKANGFDVSATGELNFSDVADVETYAAEAMQWAVSAGLIGGYEDGLLRPAATATRAQVAAIMERFVQNLL